MKKCFSLLLALVLSCDRGAELLRKTKKVGASASPPAAGKEVNSVSRVPKGVVCFVARMPRAFAFLFWIGGASVLARYSIN